MPAKDIYNCNNCAESFESYADKKFCSRACYQDHRRKQSELKETERLNSLLAAGAILCEICHAYAAHDIRQHLKYTHKIEVKDYPHACLSKKTLKIYSERMKGDSNPAKDHGGRLSPLSDKFIYAETTDKNAIIEKISKSNAENGNNDTTLLYWIKRGYTEDEARLKLKDRQTTFSLDKCIDKYGEVKGIERWKKRQEKWQTSLLNKTEEEITIINQKKGTGRMNQLFSSRPEMKEIDGILYYARFYNDDVEFWKVGITSRSFKERFSNIKKSGLSYDLIAEKKGTFYDMYKKEQEILNDHKHARINVDYKGFKTTEAFSHDIGAF